MLLNVSGGAARFPLPASRKSTNGWAFTPFARKAAPAWPRRPPHSGYLLITSPKSSCTVHVRDDLSHRCHSVQGLYGIHLAGIADCPGIHLPVPILVTKRQPEGGAPRPRRRSFTHRCGNPLPLGLFRIVETPTALCKPKQTRRDYSRF